MQFDKVLLRESDLSQFHSRQPAHHVAFAHLLEHLAHLRILPEKVVHFLHRSARSAGDALATAAVDHVVVTAFVSGHRIDDGFDMIDLFFINLVGVLLQPGEWADAGQHSHQILN